MHSDETPWLPCILYVNCWRGGNCKHWGEEQPLFRSEVLSAPYRKMTAPFAQNFMAASGWNGLGDQLSARIDASPPPDLSDLRIVSE